MLACKAFIRVVFSPLERSELLASHPSLNPLSHFYPNSLFLYSTSEGRPRCIAGKAPTLQPKFSAWRL